MISNSRNSLELLGDRKFGVYWAGSLLSNMGTWMQQMAEPWLILNLTGSSVLLGLDAFAMDGPVWLLILFGGWLADHGSRRRIIFGFQAAQMLCPVILVALILTHVVSAWMVIALSLIVGITDALSMPAFQTVVPGMVKSEEINRAIALNSTQFNLSRVAGPALAGWIMVHYGAVGCFSANAFSYIPLLLSVYFVIPKGRVQGPASSEPLLSQIKENLKNKNRREALLTVVTMSLFGGPVISFCPVIIRNVMHGGPEQFGNALTAFGVGGLVGAVILSIVDGAQLKMKGIAMFGLIYAAVELAIAMNRSPFGLEALLVLSGVFLTMINTSINSRLQFHAPNHLRGQISSLYMLAMRGGLAVGNLVAGVVIHAIGVGQCLAVNAFVIIAVLLWRMWRAEEEMPLAS